MTGSRAFFVRATILTLLTSPVPSVMAKMAGPPTSADSLIRMPKPSDKTDEQLRGNGGHPMLTTSYVGRPGEPVMTARAFLVAQPERFGLTSTQAARLRLVARRDEAEFSVVRFEKIIDDLPIYGGDIAITVLNEGRVLYTANQSIQKLDASLVKHRPVDRQQALDRARAYLGSTTLKPVAARLVAFIDADGAHPAWKIQLVQRGQPSGDWELLVDAVSGDVLRAEDRALRTRARGLVFNPDPLSSSRSHYGAAGLVDDADRNTPQLTRAQFPAIFPAGKENGHHQLAGPYAVCTDFEPPYDSACPIAKTSMLYFDRSHVSFEAVNAYYHLTSYLDYVNRTLGVKAAPYQYAGGLQFDPHGLDGADNSHYIPSTGQLAFGQGGVDDAEDADVIVHELGHALHDWLTEGRLSNAEGLSEGLGDYLAAGYSRDMNQWQPSDPQYHWVMNWDGHNEFWAGRVTNWHLGRRYQEDVRRASLHEAGQYWSSCNLAARDAIGGVAMDRAVLKGIAMTHSDSNQREAAQAVVSAAVAMRYPQAHINALLHAYNVTCSYRVEAPTTTL
ncbi:peptidase [Burkholderia cepacia]|uniref:Peptidase n=2 Tax=Burkholderia cepacia TaxID=292 RepID=A0A2S8HYV7_BURCE|nr:peptidase [Burkholderia cepacia]HDR9512127.1 PepSY domain-containing protein [Burkholderia cepacia]